MAKIPHVPGGRTYLLKGSTLNKLIRFHNQWRNFTVKEGRNPVAGAKSTLTRTDTSATLEIVHAEGADTTPTPTITGVTCVSRIGNGNLRGWNKPVNEDGGDWNTRKALRLKYEIGLNPFPAFDSFETADPPCSGALCTTQYYEYTGFFAGWDPVTNAESEFLQQRGCVCGDVCSDFADIDFGSVLHWHDDEGGTVSFPDDWTWLRSIPAAALGEDCFDGGAFTCCETYPFQGHALTAARGAYSESWSMVAFDTVAAAQMRSGGGGTVGSSCETTPGTIASTAPFPSTAGISLTGSPRSVTATMAFGDLVDGADYEITFDLTRRNSTTNAFISTNSVTITFTAGGTTDSVDYPVPVETGVKVTFETASVVIAAM